MALLRAARLIAHAATTDAYRAIAFYNTLLRFGVPSKDEYAVALDRHGDRLRLRKVEKVVPWAYTAVGWEVKNIERVVEQLSGKGVSFERHNFLHQDALGIWRAPSGTFVAWFRDPDQNLLSVSEPGPA